MWKSKRANDYDFASQRTNPREAVDDQAAKELVGPRSSPIRSVNRDKSPGQPSVQIRMTDADGGKIEMRAGSTTVTLDQNGMSISTSKFKTDASEIETKASRYEVQTPQARFSAMVNCQLLKSTAVNGDLVRTAIGNIW